MKEPRKTKVLGCDMEFQQGTKGQFHETLLRSMLQELMEDGRLIPPPANNDQNKAIRKAMGITDQA